MDMLFDDDDHHQEHKSVLYLSQAQRATYRLLVLFEGGSSSLTVGSRLALKGKTEQKNSMTTRGIELNIKYFPKCC